MTQEVTVPDDILLDVSGLDLRQLDELGDSVLTRAVATVLAMADEPTQVLAGFNSKLPQKNRPETTRPTRPKPGSDAPDRDAGIPDRDAQ